jgi:hypothetical protein
MSHRALDQGSGRRRAGSSDQLELLQSPETSLQHQAVGSRTKGPHALPLCSSSSLSRGVFWGHVTGSEVMTTAMNVLRRLRERAPALLDLSTEVLTDVA